MKALVVVDYQVDFVDGALGFPGAEKLEQIILDKIASPVPSLDHLIRVFFSCAIPHFLWVLLAFTRFGIQTHVRKTFVF